MQAFYDVVLPGRGPALFLGFKEYVPDPAAPEGIRDSSPGVEVMITAHWVLNGTWPGDPLVWSKINATFDSAGLQAYASMLAWTSRVAELGERTVHGASEGQGGVRALAQGEACLPALGAPSAKLTLGAAQRPCQLSQATGPTCRRPSC